MSSFFDIGIASHLGSDNQLMKLDKLLNWQVFSALLSDIHGELGPIGYPPISMFKLLLLGQWHSLSDPMLEQSLRVRLDFLRFTGFSLGGDLPDETTICRFRNKLVVQGKFDVLFAEINRQLEALGLKIKSAETAIVDATIITANARPRRVLEIGDDGEYQEIQSADPDARWLKKGKKSYFGYRGFARCDDEGFVEKTHVTPANQPETKELERAIEGVKKGTRVQADKGFFSAENKAMLRAKKLRNGLMYKAFRNTPITPRQTIFNKLISKTRWRIEQCFGTLKRRFCYARATYWTTEKVSAQFAMKAMCLNLLKAINKLEFA